MVKHIEITPALRQAIDAVREADATYLPGGESASVIELPKLALADAFLEALRAQALDGLPRRADQGVVYVRLKADTTRRRG